ncbi:MAG: protein phosphatase 2C domain-containing protein [Chloroflexi bacterium]|nr:protein phosphatase 2C domain-containing protein [Chloroflexota bacterium]
METLVWRVVGASVQGTSHFERDTPCQDAHQYMVLPAGMLVVAVADGAGTAARSDEGAAVAVRQAMSSLQTALAERAPSDEIEWCTVMSQAFEDARAAIVQLTAQDDSLLRDFATTLTCVVTTADQVIAGQIGDGLAVAQDASGNLLTLARPQRGEYANEAYFLTMPQANDYVDIQVHPFAAHALAVSTDGLLRLALELPQYEPHAPFFTPLFAFATTIEDEALATQQLTDFLASARVCARTDDDKTLVLAARLPLQPAEPDILTLASSAPAEHGQSEESQPAA